MSNPRIPTYDSNVGIQVVEQPNPEGAAAMMINAFRNFGDTASSIAQGITKEAADQQRETLKNNISNTYRQFSLDALRNPDQNAALSEYTEKSKQYAAGLMQQTNHFNRPYVSNLVDYYHNEHQYSIEKNAIAQNQRVLSVDAYKRINDSTRDWEDAINNSKPMVDEKGNDVQFDSARSLFADQLRNMEDYADRKLIDPATMGKGRNELMKKYVTSEYLKRYQDHVQQGLGNQFIAQIKDPNYTIPGTSEQEKYQIVNQMIKIRDQGTRGAHVAIGQLQYRMSDNLVNVENGGMPNADLQTEIKNLDPIKGAHYDEQVEIAQSKYSAKQATMYKSPEEKAAYIKSLYDIDYNTPSSAKMRRIADASTQAIDKQDKEMRADPLEFVMRNPAIKESVNEYEQAFNAGAVGQEHKYTPFNSTVPKPWDSIIQEQLHLGMTINGKNENSVRLLGQSEVNTRVNQIMQADPLDKVVAMNKLSEEFGGGLPFKLALRQMVNAGLPRNYAVLASIDPNSPDAKMLAESVSVPASDVQKELKSRNSKAVDYIAQRSVNDVFNLQTGGTNNFKALLGTIPKYSDQFNLEFRKNMSDDVTQIANYVALTQQVTPDQAVRKAQNIIANRYNYVSMNNNMIRLPKEVSDLAVKRYADQKQKELFTFNFNMDGVDKVRAQRALKYGHWANDAIDDGLVWVDSSGKMWTDKNGHPYGFSFRDADVGMQHINLPVTKKAEQPKQQEVVDLGTYNSEFTSGTPNMDDELDRIDQIGEERLKAGEKQGKKFRKLINSAKGDQ